MNRPKRIDEVAANPHPHVHAYARYAKGLEDQIEDLKLYIGILALETDELMGIAVPHGFKGWEDHLALGDKIRSRLGIKTKDRIKWTTDLMVRARKALR